MASARNNKLFLAAMAGLLYLLLCFFVTFQQSTCLQCKVTPDSPDWPTDEQWQALNASVSGRLVRPSPPGAVCHPDLPQYDSAACSALATQWTSSSWHLTQPATVNYNDDACRPTAGTPCSSAAYPAYVIAATSASDVQAGVKFAAETGVRLIVRATGHDQPGRSSGPGALSIWTHNIRGVDFDLNDSRVFNGAVGTAKVAAGMTVAEALSAAAEQNLTLITGSDSTVGVMGWLSGGGHGAITSRYGLGADNVVEMEVVTPQGELLTLNADSYPDLFWAVRGGGGSTFGVIVSATVLAYPDIPISLLTAKLNTTVGNDAFWDLLTLLHTDIPRLNDAGVMGYYYYASNHSDPAPQAMISTVFLVPEKSVEETQAIFAPLVDAITSSSWGSSIQMYNMIPRAIESYAREWSGHPPEAVGGTGRIGSHLLDEKALTADTASLKTALQKSTPPTALQVGHLVTGPGPRDIEMPSGGNAVLPSFRTSYAHLVLVVSWDPLDAAAKQAQTTALQGYVDALKELAPDMGEYISESSAEEPEWQIMFWGDNYPRLLSIKQQWDPDGVFWCVPCVGHELWTVSSGSGIGQDGGQICR